jgi:hypothetical protein
LFLFLSCFSLLPLSCSLLGPILISIYAVIGIYFFYILGHGWRWKPAVASGAVLIYMVIYALFGLYSLLLSQAEQELIFKDSVGFLFYPAYLPLATLMVEGKIGRPEWERFLIFMGIVVSVFHVFAYFVFYYLFGSLTSDTLLTVNGLLKEIGTASKFATGGGVLRVDSGLGVLLIIPVLVILLRIFHESARLKNLLIIIILLLGILLEGHRALAIVVMGVCFLYVVWIVSETRNYSKIFSAMIRLLITLSTIFLILIIMFGDDLTMVAGRFTNIFDDNSSVALLDPDRAEQITPLLNKILDAPILGNGFGSNASLIRSADRPFMYELDYLAVFMKLGLVGGFFYFSAYIYLMYLGIKRASVRSNTIVYFFAGLAYFFYAGTNGGLAMSVFSTMFHLYLMIGLSVEYHPTNHKR